MTAEPNPPQSPLSVLLSAAERVEEECRKDLESIAYVLDRASGMLSESNKASLERQRSDLNTTLGFARAAALLAGALEKIKTGIRENGNDTVWVGPGCTAEDAIDAALASAARLVAEAGGAKGDGKEGGR